MTRVARDQSAVWSYNATDSSNETFDIEAQTGGPVWMLSTFARHELPKINNLRTVESGNWHV